MHLVPEAYLRKTSSDEDCCEIQGLKGSKHDCRQGCGISAPTIWLWSLSHPLEVCWCGLHCQLASEWHLWYHLKWADAVQQWILHLLDPVRTMVVHNWHPGAPENHQTTFKTFQMTRDASCEPYIRVNLVNALWQQFPHCCFGTAKYWQCERAI